MLDQHLVVRDLPELLRLFAQDRRQGRQGHESGQSRQVQDGEAGRCREEEGRRIRVASHDSQGPASAGPFRSNQKSHAF